ncbi:MAG: cysteine desulfurase [Frankiales bacterium]|nr:cysteine desulfurase [Frankiales bacterium]
MSYLDAASTEPLHPAARSALLAAIDDGWADPQRLYGAARRTHQLLDDARAATAGHLGARPDEVSFTASGTQALHLGVLGVLGGRRRVGDHVVASAVEHSAVLHALDFAGAQSTLVEVDRAGRTRVPAFASALRADTALACLQTANHEVGTVQPVAEVAARCQAAGVPLLSDAAQSVGRVPVDVTALGVSVLTASAHKWGGPAGVGVLVVRKGTRWRSPVPYDEREGRRVPGFENVPAILAAVAALDAVAAERDETAARHSHLIDRLRARLPELVPDIEIVGDPVQRLPHLLTFSCLYVNGEALLGALDAEEFAVSSGSSCTASTLAPSHVLEAMGVLTHGNIRVSLSRTSTEADVERLLAVLPGVVARLRADAGVVGL